MQRKISIAVAIIILAAIGFYAINRSNGDIKSEAQASIGTSVGKIAPDFVITTIEGEKITSVSLRGKVVVITSSAAWCPTCVMEARQFAPVYQKYKDKPIVFITVDIDPRDSKDFIRQFKIDNNTPWYYTDAQGGAEITQKYSFNRFEITYILDRQGIIRFKDQVITSSDKLDQEIQELL